MAPEARRFLHFNSCIYELTVIGDGTEAKTSHRLLQKNNALIFEDFSMVTMPAETSPAKAAYERMKEAAKDTDKFYSLYPWKKITDLDDEKDYILLQGYLLEEVPAPSTKSEEESKETAEETIEEKALEQALTVQYRRVFTTIFVPLDPKCMCDLTISHVPPTAVVRLPTGSQEPQHQPIPEEMAAFEAHLNTLLSTLTEEERTILAKVREYAAAQGTPGINLAEFIESVKEEYPDLTEETLRELLAKSTLMAQEAAKAMFAKVKQTTEEKSE